MEQGKDVPEGFPFFGFLFGEICGEPSCEVQAISTQAARAERIRTRLRLSAKSASSVGRFQQLPCGPNEERNPTYHP